MAVTQTIFVTGTDTGIGKLEQINKNVISEEAAKIKESLLQAV